MRQFLITAITCAVTITSPSVLANRYEQIKDESLACLRNAFALLQPIQVSQLDQFKARVQRIALTGGSQVRGISQVSDVDQASKVYGYHYGFLNPTGSQAGQVQYITRAFLGSGCGVFTNAALICQMSNQGEVIDLAQPGGFKQFNFGGMGFTCQLCSGVVGLFPCVDGHCSIKSTDMRPPSIASGVSADQFAQRNAEPPVGVGMTKNDHCGDLLEEISYVYSGG